MRCHLASVHADRPPQFGVVQPRATTVTSCPRTGRDVMVNSDVVDDEDAEDDEDEDAARYSAGLDSGVYTPHSDWLELLLHSC